MSKCLVSKCLQYIISVSNNSPVLRKCNYVDIVKIQLNLQTLRFCHENGESKGDKDKSAFVTKSGPIPLGVSSKFKVFKDEDASVILDVEEERSKFQDEVAARLELLEDEFAGINLQRGTRGVFDVEELVALLRRDRAENIFVVALPAYLKYVDHIIFVTGKSRRHRLAVAEFVRKVFKRKQHSSDITPRIEGENSNEWLALDLGNIALHIMSKSARELYDIEMLWSVGAEYDDQCNKPDDAVVSLLKHHAIYLGDLKPLENHG